MEATLISDPLNGHSDDNIEGADRPGGAEVPGSIREPGGPARGAIFQRSTELSTELLEKRPASLRNIRPRAFCRLRWVWTRTAALPSAGALAPAPTCAVASGSHEPPPGVAAGTTQAGSWQSLWTHNREQGPLTLTVPGPLVA